MTTFVANGLLGSTSLSSESSSNGALSKSNAILGALLTPQTGFHAGGEKQQEAPGKLHVFMVAQNLIVWPPIQPFLLKAMDCYRILHSVRVRATRRESVLKMNIPYLLPQVHSHYPGF